MNTYVKPPESATRAGGWSTRAHGVLQLVRVDLHLRTTEEYALKLGRAEVTRTAKLTVNVHSADGPQSAA